MYAALRANQLIRANDVTKEMVHEKFVCPKCQKTVVFVSTNEKNNYFRHELNTVPNAETIEHMTAKGIIKTALISLGINADLEVPLATNQLRADVYLSTPKQSFAIEIQCAPLNSTEYQRRHHLYQVSGVKDIWILGRRHFLTKHLHQIHFDVVQENHHWRNYIIEVDVFNHQIILKYNLEYNPITKKVRYQIKKFELDEFGIFSLLNFRPHRLIKYQNKKDDDLKYLIKQATAKTKLGMRFGEYCYLNQIQLWDFPSEKLPGFVPLLQNKKPFLEDS